MDPSLLSMLVMCPAWFFWDCRRIESKFFNFSKVTEIESKSPI